MKKVYLLLLILSLVGISLAYEPHFMDDPAISPDGKMVCFSYLGDLWLVPFEGGEAKRISFSESYESNPSISPNGKWIAFNSNRAGNTSIFVMPIDGGEARQVRDCSLSLDGWYANSKALLVTKRVPYGRGNLNMKLSLDGKKMEQVNPYTDSYSYPSPDGNKVIFNKQGMPFRESYKGSLNGDLWEYDKKLEKFNRLTQTETTERYPVYSHKSDKIYYAGSDGEIFQLFCVENRDFGNPKQLSNFDTWSVRDIDIAVANDRIVFEMFDEIWRYDPKAMLNKFAKIDIEIVEDTWHDLDRYESVRNKFKNFSVSPDEKLLAFNYKYDLFAMPVKGGEVKQLTHDQRGINDIFILPDNKTIFFTSYEKGVNRMYKINIFNPDVIEKVDWANDKHIDNVDIAPNKQYLVEYSLNEKDINRLALMDSTATKFTVIEKDNTPWYGFEISENGKYALYTTRDVNVWNSKLHFYEFETGFDQVIFSDDNWIGSASWGKDNNSVFFVNSSTLFRMDLSPINEFKFKHDHWEDILVADSLQVKEEKMEDIAIDWDNLEKRITPIVKKDKWPGVFTVRNDSILYYWQGKELYKTNYQGKNEKLIYTFNHDWRYSEYNFDSNNIYFVGAQKLYKVNLNNGTSKEIKSKFDYQYNELELNKKVFEEVWGDFGRGFYDPKMHNVDWDEAYNKYFPYTDYMYKPSLLSDIIEEMIGEVNASHTGFYPRREKRQHYFKRGMIGAAFDWDNRLKKGIVLKKVYLYSALNEIYKINDGAILLSIDGEEITKDTVIEKLLRDKVGKKLHLTISQEGKLIEAEIKCLSWSEQYYLGYHDWVETRKRKVQAVDPDLGYVHVKAMSESNYTQFVEDLFSTEYTKKGLVLDFRGNSGGRVHDKILEVIMKKQYAWESSRWRGTGKYRAPGKVYDKPIVLLIDQRSFSDGEIFPHIFKHLKLGTIVGVPTSGSVIGTVPHDLMDGSSMRMPRNGWWLDNEELTNLEGNGAQPDIIVEMTPADIVNDNDVQLKKAIEILLEQVKE